ncbi:hypothetical protein ACFXTI_010376 [Malus domestica]
MGSRRSTRQNTVVNRVAPPLRGSTMAQAMPSKLARARAQASHSHAPCTEQPAPAIQLAPVIQPAPALMASQAAQVGSRLSQPSRPIIEPGAFSPHFFADLTFRNSNLALEVYHPFIVQGAFHPSSSNLNSEQHLSGQVIELTSTLAQQMTLVNQLLQRTEIQRAPNEKSQSKTRVDEPFQQRPGKQLLNQS